jgi:hypothetical protein
VSLSESVMQGVNGRLGVLRDMPGDNKKGGARYVSAGSASASLSFLVVYIMPVIPSYGVPHRRPERGEPKPFPAGKRVDKPKS